MSQHQNDGAGKKNRSLKNLILFPRYQFRIVFLTVLASFFLTCLHSLVFYLFTRENYKILVDLSPMEENVKQQLYYELQQIIFILTGVSFFSILLFALLALYISHKTAGPLYRLKLEFMNVCLGKRPSKIFLREGDDFQEVMNDFNQMVDHLNHSQSLR